MGSTIKGSPGETQVELPPPLRPPNYGFSNWLGNQFPGLWGQELPSYGKNLDQGLSPTMQRTIHFLQGQANSPAPRILGQAQGTLGALMDPGMSGLRNPYSMSSMSGGGGMAMTPQALQSSRDAMLRFQNPQYNLAQPRIKQGAPSPFGQQPGYPPPPPGGGGGKPTTPPGGTFPTTRFDVPASGISTQGPGEGGMQTQEAGGGGPMWETGLYQKPGGVATGNYISQQGGLAKDGGAGRTPLSQNPNFMLNPNYKPRAPGDNSYDLRPTDQQFIPQNMGGGLQDAMARFPQNMGGGLQDAMARFPQNQGGGQQQNPKGGGMQTMQGPPAQGGIQGILQQLGQLNTAAKGASQRQENRSQTLTGRGNAPSAGNKMLAAAYNQSQQQQAQGGPAAAGSVGAGSKLWYSGTPEGKNFVPDLSANPYLPGGGYDKQAAIRRYGKDAAGGNAPGYRHPQPHGAETLGPEQLMADVASGKAPPGVMEILKKAGIQGPINQLSYRDLSMFGSGGGRTYLQDLDRIYKQQEWQSAEGQKTLGGMDPATAAAIRAQYGIGGGAPTGSITPSLGGINPKGPGTQYTAD